jgi:hypothetical protein
VKDDEGESTIEKMKIVIGYAGSENADMALDDLRQAWLPRDAGALIISVAEGAAPLSVSEFPENALNVERIASAATYASNAIAGKRIRASWGRAH